MTKQTTFVPSGTAITATPQELSTTINMPTYDGGNLDCSVTYTGETPCYLTFSAVTTGDGKLRGEVVVPPSGIPVLLTANAATLAAAAANNLVVNSPNSGAAASVAIIAGMRGGTLTIQRGTATSRLVF